MKKGIKEALEYIHSTNRFGSVLGLDNITRLLELIGNPQNELKFIHVAGTNGKGSTSSYITNILKEANYKVGFFTSPYIEVFNERMRINDDYIKDEDIAEITFVVKEQVDKMLEEGYNHPTEFEIVTAIAMEYYKRKKVDFVVLEVGMGGRYDSTNAISKTLVSVITPIGLDHVEILGDTIEKIAYEKAGIIKENSLVVYTEQEKEAEKVIEEVAIEKNSKYKKTSLSDINIKKINGLGSIFDLKTEDGILENLEIKMIGKHQIQNAALAIETIIQIKNKENLNISKENIYKGLIETRWMGRLELLSENPMFVIDGAHNKQGIDALKKSIDELFDYKRLIMGIGILADKDVDEMIGEIAPLADKIIVTEPGLPRAMTAEELGSKIKNINYNVEIIKDIEKSIDIAIESYEEGDLILFLGSLYLIGDVRKIAIKKLK